MSQIIYLIVCVIIAVLINSGTLIGSNVAERARIKVGFMTLLSGTMELDEELENLNFIFDENLSKLCGSDEIRCDYITGELLRVIELIRNQYLIVRTYRDNEIIQSWCQSLYNKKELIRQLNVLNDLQSSVIELVIKKFQQDLAEWQKNAPKITCYDYKSFKDRKFCPFFLNLMLVEMKLMTTIIYSAWEMAPLMINVADETADELTYGWESHLERVKSYATHSLDEIGKNISIKLHRCEESFHEMANTKLVRNFLMRYKSDWMNLQQANALMHTIIKTQRVN